MDLDARD
jgi:hypothetical protein